MWKNHGFSRKRIYKRWVLHIYVSLQEGFIRKVADKTWGIPAGTRVINHIQPFLKYHG
jgi:hypothetical protein